MDLVDYTQTSFKEFRNISIILTITSFFMQIKLDMKTSRARFPILNLSPTRGLGLEIWA